MSRLAFLVLLLPGLAAAQAAPEPLFSAGFDSATVTISVSDVDGAAVADAELFLNGAPLGRTDAAGRHTARLPTGTVQLLARGDDGGASMQPTIRAGTGSLALVLSWSGMGRDAGLLVSGIDAPGAGEQGAVIESSGVGALRIALDDAPIAQLRALTLRSANGVGADVTLRFELQQGALAVSDAAALASTLQNLGAAGPVTFALDAVDATGFEVQAETALRYADRPLAGTLLAPPSAPALGLAGIPVAISIGHGTNELRRIAVSGAGGAFAFGLLPAGSGELFAQAASGGIVYSAQRALAVDGSSAISVALAGPLDFPTAGSDVPATVAVPAQQRDTDDSARRARALERELRVIAPRPTALSPTLVATSAAQGQGVARSASVPLPPALDAVTLRYVVVSAEYPTYVLSQSLFDDRWSVRLLGADGSQLHGIARGVNSQLSQPPVWQSSGSTGEILVDIAIPPALRGQSLILSISATNVGDALYPTTVHADVSADDGELQLTMVSDSNDGHRWISLPLGGSNAGHARHATLAYEPADAVIASVDVELKSRSGALLASYAVSDFSAAGGQVRVPFTFAQSSPLASASTHGITYGYRVGATVAGQSVSATATSGEFRALWPAPTGLPRVGQRDAGADDWSTTCTRSWLDANRSGVPAMNDVSLHHGKARSTGSTHRKGRHVDVFEFVDLVPDVPMAGGKGSANHARLRDHARKFATLPAGTERDAAQLALVGWIGGQRGGLQPLLAQSGVGQIRAGLGEASTPLAGGWKQELLTQGRLGGVAVLAVPSAFGSAKLQFDNAHNDHLHIDLLAQNITSGCIPYD